MTGNEAKVTISVSDEASASIARVRAGLDSFAKDANNSAMSARQLSFAMRTLPAQFTDIFTGLASGQAPMTVLIQQGGQIKDIFGGIAPAARAVGTAVMGMITPLTVAAGAVGALVLAFKQGSDEAKELRKALIETGQASGLTAPQLTQMAAAMASVSNITQGKASEALVAFVRAGGVGSENLQEFTRNAIELERAGGQSIEKTAAAFAKLADAPTKGVLELNKSMNFLTTSMYEQIRALEKSGKVVEAARIAQEEYSKAQAQQARELREDLGTLERAWLGLRDAAKKAWDAILNVGRPEDRLAAIDRQIAELEALFSNPALGIDPENSAKDLEALRQRRILLLAEIEGRKGAAQAAAEQAKAVNALAAADEKRAKAAKPRDDSARLAREMAQAWEQFEEAQRRLDVEDAKRLAGLKRTNEELRFQIQTVGKSKDETVKLEQARIDDAIATLEQKVAMERLGEGREQDIKALQEEIRLLKERRELIGEKRLADAEVERAEASRKAAADAQNEWKRAAEQIEQSLTDALVRGFEGGKNVLRSIGDYIVNYFKTTIARGIAQALMGAMASGLSGAASAFGGGGGGGLNLSSLLSIGSSVAGSSGIGGAAVGTTLLGTFGSLGAGFMSGLTGAGSTAAISGLMANGSIGAAAGMGIGMAVPYIAAAYALYRIISGKGTGRDRSPAFQEFSALTGGLEQLTGRYPTPNVRSSNAYDAQLRALIGTIGVTAGMFGGSANPNLGYGLYTSTSPDGKGAQSVANVWDASGRALFGFNVNGSNSDVMQRLASAMPAMILVGLQQSQLPRQISEYFNSVSANGITQETLDRMVQTAAAAHQMADAFKDLGGPFADLANISVEARVALADLTGGMDAFAQKVGGYYSAFYSAEEQQALSLVQAQRILQDAGIDTSALTSRASFRSAVEGLNVNTPEGQQQFAAFMNAAAAFAAGSDLLGLSGMSLREFTAGAPGLEVAIDPVVAAQLETNELLRQIAENTRPGAQVVQVDVRTSDPSSVEVGYFMASTSEN